MARSRRSSKPSTASRRKKPIPSFLRIGSWIGGDRDGNPFVTAEVLHEACGCKARARSPLSRRVARARRRTVARRQPRSGQRGAEALADRGRRCVANRRDEPYRRAISGMYSRLAKTARELDQSSRSRQPIADAPPYADRRRTRADLDVIAASLEANGGAIIARGRLRALRRAVDCSASISRRWTCGRTPTCTSERWRRSWPRRRRGSTIERIDRGRAHRLLRRELRSPRPLVSPFLAYSEETAGELGVFRAAAAIRKTYGPGAIRTAIISKTDSVSDLLELALLAEGGRPRRRRRVAPRSSSCRCSRRSTICAPASA